MGFANPANSAFLSVQFGADQQATVNAVQHLCSNLSRSLSIELFSSPLMFQPGAQRDSAMRPFLTAFLFSLVGCTVKARLAVPHLQSSRDTVGEKQAAEEGEEE